MNLNRVWQPLQIGNVEIKNRVVRAANSTTMSPDSLNEDLIAFHEARARGGVGLSILEAAAVHPNSQIGYLVDKQAVGFYQQFMDRIRPHGMKVFQQLWHGGHSMYGAGDAMPWSASATASPLSGIVGVPMTQSNIDELIAAFASAAAVCKEGGLDGVEIHAAHGYLIAQFLSPLTNLRTDKYNGALMNRARFLIEVLQAVRSEVGSDFVVGVRMGPSTAKGGTSVEDVATIARHLEAEGLIDFLDITYSDYFFLPGEAHSMAHSYGYQLPINEPIAHAVKRVPRLVTGRFRTLEEAEQVLTDDQADMVSLTRAHIAEPEIVLKTREGRVEDIRPCIACNQGCMAGFIQNGRMQCTVNPAAGSEQMLDETLIVQEQNPKKVLVVGGGPAGMEAARVSALRGHEVILTEANTDLGGALNIAKTAPNLHILEDLVQWLERQVYKLGVDVRLNHYMEANDVLAENPDTVIIATGSKHVETGRQTAIPGELPTGVDLPHVYNPKALLMAQEMSGDYSGKTALVFDDVGSYDAIAAAEYLQAKDVEVTFATSQASFAPKMFGTFRDTESLIRMRKKGHFNLITNAHLLAIETGSADIRLLGSEASKTVPADIVVVATNQIPIRNLYEMLETQIPNMQLVGDALSPRDLTAAIHDGHRCARAI